LIFQNVNPEKNEEMEAGVIYRACTKMQTITHYKAPEIH